jgi:hypothetical protein
LQTPPGVWAGSVVRTGKDGVHVLTSQEKWNKAKRLLKEVWEMLEKNPEKLLRKRLGFLQYVRQTYTGLTSYLIGFHMMIDGFRRGCDADGWRRAEALWKEERKDDEDWSRAEVAEEEIPE